MKRLFLIAILFGSFLPTTPMIDRSSSEPLRCFNYASDKSAEKRSVVADVITPVANVIIVLAIVTAVVYPEFYKKMLNKVLDY